MFSTDIALSFYITIMMSIVELLNFFKKKFIIFFFDEAFRKKNEAKKNKYDYAVSLVIHILLHRHVVLISRL